MLDEFSLAGGAGRFTAKGTLARAADQGTPAAGRVDWQAEKFTIVNRPDLRLVADGKGTLALEERKLALSGSIDIDEGRIEYEPSRVGTLSDDVVIVGQPRKASDSAVRDLPLVLDLEVALGRDFRFSGEGLDTRLAGRVHVTTTPAGTLAAKGTIRAVAGTYDAFGQRLVIDRGRLLFDGPVDNPALDVVALRKNLAVEAGVELTGTVKVPRVRLVSNPPVPDGEKLSWLLTGQGLDRASRNDLAVLGAASASLLGQNKKPITTQIANTVGLDDISVRDTGGVGGHRHVGPGRGVRQAHLRSAVARLRAGIDRGVERAAHRIRADAHADAARRGGRRQQFRALLPADVRLTDVVCRGRRATRAVEVEAVLLDHEAVAFVAVDHPFDRDVVRAQRVSHLLAVDERHPAVGRAIRHQHRRAYLVAPARAARSGSAAPHPPRDRRSCPWRRT